MTLFMNKVFYKFRNLDEVFRGSDCSTGLLATEIHFPSRYLLLWRSTIPAKKGHRVSLHFCLFRKHIFLTLMCWHRHKHSSYVCEIHTESYTNSHFKEKGRRKVVVQVLYLEWCSWMK